MDRARYARSNARNADHRWSVARRRGADPKATVRRSDGRYIEYHRDKDTGIITTTDVKLSHADTLMVREDTAEYKVGADDAPVDSAAMVVEFRAVDSTGKNKEGKPYRIENTIDIQHELMPSATPGHQVVK